MGNNLENYGKTAAQAFARVQFPFQFSTNIQIFSTVRESGQEKAGLPTAKKKLHNPKSLWVDFVTRFLKPFFYYQVNCQWPCLICSSLTGMATMAKEQNYSSLLPCPSLLPSSVWKFFGVLFGWVLGLFKKDKKFFRHPFISLKLSITLPLLSVTAKNPQTNVEVKIIERDHRECTGKWERELKKTRGGASLCEPQQAGSLCLYSCSAP